MSGPRHVSLSDLIGDVISLRPNEEMFGINAWPVVAVVTNAGTMSSGQIGQWTIVNGETHSVCGFAVPRADNQYAITNAKNWSLPRPAFVFGCPIDLCPKSFFYKLWGYLDPLLKALALPRTKAGGGSATGINAKSCLASFTRIKYFHRSHYNTLIVVAGG